MRWAPSISSIDRVDRPVGTAPIPSTRGDGGVTSLYTRACPSPSRSPDSTRNARRAGTPVYLAPRHRPAFRAEHPFGHGALHGPASKTSARGAAKAVVLLTLFVRIVQWTPGIRGGTLVCVGIGWTASSSGGVQVG